MFENISMTGVGILVLVITYILQLLGYVNVDHNTIVGLATSIVQFIGFLWAVIGQIRRPDLQAGLFRVEK